MAEYRAMVYNKQYVLNIDNILATTHRNHKYVASYYSSHRDIVPKPIPAYSAVHAFRSTMDFRSPKKLKETEKELKVQISQL